MSFLNINSANNIFLYWNDICGSTNLFASCQVSIDKDKLTEKNFLQAYQNLQKKHPIINSYWSFSDNSEYKDFKLLFSDSVREDLSIIKVDSPITEKYISEYHKSILGRCNDLKELGNVNVEVVTFLDSKFLITVYADHTLLDGKGVDRLLSDFLNLIYNPEFNIEKNVKPIDDLLPLNFDLENSFEKRYFKEVLSKNYRYNPSNKSVDWNRGVFNIKKLSFNINKIKRVTEVLNDTSVFALYLQSLVKSLFNRQKTDNILIEIPTYGRREAEENYPEGCYAKSITILFDEEYFRLGRVNQLSWISNYINEAKNANLDIKMAERASNAIVSSSGLREKLKEESFKSTCRKRISTNVYFSFFGVSEFQVIDNQFQYYLGTTNHSGVIDILGIIIGDSINLYFNYDSLLYSDQMIEDIIGDIEDNILSTDLNYSNNSSSYNKNEFDVKLIEIIKKYSIFDFGEEFNYHLEIDLGIDSLKKVRMLSEISNYINVPVMDLIKFDTNYLNKFLNKLNSIY